jgi:hypothetical protein
MKKAAKSIFLKAGLCALALAALNLWFAVCASRSGKTASTGSAAEKRGLAVEELPKIVADDVPRKTGGRQNPSAYSLGFYDFSVAVIK